MAEQKEAMKNLSLSDVFSDLFILGTHVKNSKELGYADSLRKRTIDMFASAERKGRDAGYAEELLTQAKYALAAFLDEMIMGSPWSDKEQWSVNPLQYEFFKESVAGVEFFNRLEAIRRAYPVNRELLELYFVCLILGFEGQYKIHGREKLKDLVESVGQDLNPKKTKKPSLSPQGRRPDELFEVVRQGLPSWVVIVSTMGVIFFFYLTLSFVMNSSTNRVVERIGSVMEAGR